MELTGERIINVPRETLYRALHDPALLRQAIPGCQRFERRDDGSFEADIALKIGPLSSTFRTAITIYNADPFMGYSLHGRAEGMAGIGGGEGNAHIAFAMVDEDTTNVAYHISATPTGSIAELTPQILEAKANTLAAEFLSRVELILSSEPAPEPEPVRLSEPSPAPRPPAPPPAPERPAAASDVSVIERPPVTDETGAPTSASHGPSDAVYEPTPVHALDPDYPQVGQFNQSSRDAPIRRAAERANPLRWLLVAVGVLLIVFLLNDSF
ncbi:MAG: SRPBCC domain-containing protein [Pseudomonadota bacterium]